MKLSFNEDRWQQLQENLNVAQLCGENAGKLYAYAKGALQRASAAVAGEGDVSPPEGAQSLEVLKKLRHSAQDAAEGFAAAVADIDALIKQLEPATTGRARRRA